MRRDIVVAAVVLAAAAPRLDAAAQEQRPGPAAPDLVERDTAPVTVDGRPLFALEGVPGASAAERARAVSGRISALAGDETFDPETLEVVEVDLGTSIRARGKNVVIVTDQDAADEGFSRRSVALARAKTVKQAIERHRQERTSGFLGRALGWTAAWAAGLVLLTLLIRLSRRLDRAAERWFERRAGHLRLHGLPLVNSARAHATMTGLLRGARVIAHLVSAGVFLVIALDHFPWTRAAARAAVPVLLRPLASIGQGLLAQVPNLVFLAVLWLVTRFALRLVRTYFNALEVGAIEISGFEKEWAPPTFRIVRLLVLAFAIVVAYPYIPGSETGVFKSISLFVGVVFSLGSSSIIANVIAGYTMTYRRAFRVGDRIGVGEVVGDVVEVKVLVTRVRTTKNEDVVIPNSTILTGHVVNYSTMARQEGLILHATVGIGYETPWRQVEAVLLEAAARTPGIERTPPPFVLYKGLGDFAVTYEINGHTHAASQMVQTLAALHRNMLDLFNQYGVQIMTPAYEGDPHQPKLVPSDRWYAAPARPPAAAEADAPSLEAAPSPSDPGK